MQTVLHRLSRTLSGVYPEKEAVSVAKLLLSEGLGWGTLLLYTGKDSDLSEGEKQKIEVFTNRLMRHEPIQYVLGHALFCGYSFDVSPGVLIPRPETEGLVREVLNDWSSSAAVSVLDIGTGSGCIAITLFLEMKEAKVDAWDISSDAIAVAQRNSRNLGADICFREKDLRELTPDDGNALYDVIVSNPPYVLDSERSGIAPNVLEWEPETALFVSDQDPLLPYRFIFRAGRRLLKPGGALYVEINSQMGSETVWLMESEGYCEVQLKKDLFGKERIVKGRR